MNHLLGVVDKTYNFVSKFDWKSAIIEVRNEVKNGNFIGTDRGCWLAGKFYEFAKYATASWPDDIEFARHDSLSWTQVTTVL